MTSEPIVTLKLDLQFGITDAERLSDLARAMLLEEHQAADPTEAGHTGTQGALDERLAGVADPAQAAFTVLLHLLDLHINDAETSLGMHLLHAEARVERP